MNTVQPSRNPKNPPRRREERKVFEIVFLRALRGENILDRRTRICRLVVQMNTDLFHLCSSVFIGGLVLDLRARNNVTPHRTTNETAMPATGGFKNPSTRAPTLLWSARVVRTEVRIAARAAAASGRRE